MKEGLKAVYAATMDVFRADPRVLAAYMSGSVGTDREDEYSDVDPVVLVRPQDFAGLDRDLPAVFARVGVEPVLWWPERGNNETCRNHAVLFERDGELLQYDITIVAAAGDARVSVRRDQLIFDKAGVLEVAEPARAPGYSPERLRWRVEMYWLYVYIHAKYLKRGDRFKLIAAQQELLNVHLEVLRALHPEVPPDWWPITAARVCRDAAAEEACLSYLRCLDGGAVGRALPAQMARFAEDARAACAKGGVEYPADFEARATRYVTAALDGLKHEPRPQPPGAPSAATKQSQRGEDRCA